MQKMDIYFHFLTYGMLIGLSYGEPFLIGKNVRDARPDELLFAVSIQRRSPISNDVIEIFRNRHFCTGTLISRKCVLTAAHCVIKKNTSDVVIIAGSRDVRLGEKYYPKSWTTYDEWVDNIKQINNSLNDIAIITLEGQGVEDPKITPASVLTFDPTDLYDQKVRIAGWGTLKDGKIPLILKTAVATVISHDECNGKATKLIGQQFVVPENYFCSLANPPASTSGGDSGAPVLNRRNQLVGIHIGSCPNLKGCPLEYKNQNQMNTHLHLYHYRNFIREFTSN